MPFVIGYGSSLRRDDRVGQDVARLLRALRDRHVAPELEGARIYALHQLLPEVAADLEAASLVVFVDAAPRAPSDCTVKVRWLGPSVDLDAVAAPSGGGCWEDPAPEWLLGLARRLYGVAPAAALVSVGVADLNVGEGLSDAASRAVLEAAGVVRNLLTAQRELMERAYA